MTENTRWTIGTAVALAGFLYWQVSGVNARIDDLQTGIRSELSEIRADIRAVNERIDNILLADRETARDD